MRPTLVPALAARQIDQAPRALATWVLEETSRASSVRLSVAAVLSDAFEMPREELVTNLPCVNKLRLAMLLGGADFHSWPGGQTSCMHTDADLEQTIAAFSGAIHMLKREGEL